MLHDAVTPTPPRIGHVLDQHHREIEAACIALVTDGFTDEPGDLTRLWGDIEHHLYDHMMAEEHFLFPAYQQADPENAQVLREQHARLRQHAMQIGVAAELHAVRVEQIEAFLADLRAHAQCEEAALYRWADRHVAADDRHRMRDYLAAG
jgi:iron-sulfur cluster repair protein YtfE (RIC family)